MSTGRAWSYYTIALYILCFLLLDAAVVYRFVLGWPSTGNAWLDLIGFIFLAVALLALTIALFRSLRPGWAAHKATLFLNVLLFPWFPLGTVLSIVWFAFVRKREKQFLETVRFSGTASGAPRR